MEQGDQLSLVKEKKETTAQNAWCEIQFAHLHLFTAEFHTYIISLNNSVM